MTRREAQRYCTSLTRRSGSNFYYSFLFLPKARREAMYALYAFCREVDSTVDEATPGSDPQTRLNLYRAEMDTLYSANGMTSPLVSPVMICLAAHIQRFRIPQAYFKDIISGVEMDLSVFRYQTFQDLQTYCYRVASAVGLICLKIFGAVRPESETYAINLGIAFQLTNILRDIKTDAARGRIYLPQEDLKCFKVTEEQILAGTDGPAFRRLMAFECGRAHDFYRLAREALTTTDRRVLLPAEIMRAIYARILEKIESADYQVFRQRITVAPSRRLAIALTMWLTNGWDLHYKKRASTTECPPLNPRSE
jgi:15-cis-phytoene synthase